MKITDEYGRDPAARVREILHEFRGKLDGNGRKIVSVSIADTIKRHFQSIYPGSSHYSPDKVKVVNDNIVEIDVPGISRAFHDLTIRAKNVKYLTIPVHREAYGVSARTIQGLFYTENRNGVKMLARNEGGSLAVMYILKESVHQKRNPGLMPSASTMSENAVAALRKYLK